MIEGHDAEQILKECARLWCSNPYVEGFEVALRTAERKLQQHLGTDLVAPVRRLVRPGAGDANGHPDDVALLVLGFARRGPRFRRAPGPGEAAPDPLRPVLSRAAEEALQAGGWNLRGALAAVGRCEARLEDGLCGVSPGIRRARAGVWSAAFGRTLVVAARYGRELRRQNVLILGESGTGKEEAAQALLQGGILPTGGGAPPTQSVNVAAVPEGLVESELFGHVQGAFTGAVRDKAGVIELAHGGALFIDEVGELPTPVQAKFLRVMETGRFRRVGDGADRPADVRYVGATHRDVEAMVEAGTFRHDLFHRLNGVVVALPPLREVIDEDLLHILRRLLPGDDGPFAALVAEQIRGALAGYHWPGNVRELRNVALNLLLREPGALRRWHREPETRGAGETGGPPVPVELAEGRWTEAQVVEWYRQRAVEAHPTGTAAARALGVSTRTLERFRRGRGDRR